MSDLLKEAIADAKAVRETALQNAKMALEEAFTPQLKSMLSAKLKEEEGIPHDEDEAGDGLSDEEVETDVVDSPEGVEDVADEEAEEADEPSATAGEDEESGVPGSQVETEYEENEVGDGESEDEVPAEGEELNQEGFGDDEEVEEDDDDDDDDDEDEGGLDLEAIIRELEDEVGEEEETEEGSYEEDEEAEEMADMEETEEVPAEEAEAEEMMGAEEDEELEVDENLWKEEEETEEDEEVEESFAKISSELKEYKAAVRFLKGKLHEVNILNAKLLFTNKLFKEFALNNNQKLRVVETFDRAQSTREIKLVYSTLAEQFGDNGSIGKKSIKESASRKSGSTKPKRKVISESAQVANRFKKLAGLIK